MACTVTVTLPPTGRVVTPPDTLPAPAVTVPHTAPPVALPQLALTAVTPAGSVSANVAPSATLGPALAITIVQVMGAPGATVAGPLLTMERSATPPPTSVVAVLESLGELGSTSFTVATDAVFDSGVAPV